MTNDLHTTFIEQFAGNQHRVYGYIVTLLPNRHDAEDAFQETCVVLWQKWTTWNPESSFVAWACAIAHNVVRNFRRSRLRAAATVSLPEDLLEELAVIRRHSDALFEARGQQLSYCLEKLPANQSNLIERVYLKGETMAGVAGQLAISVDNLYLRLFRIRRALLDCINRATGRERQS